MPLANESSNMMRFAEMVLGEEEGVSDEDYKIASNKFKDELAKLGLNPASIGGDSYDQSVKLYGVDNEVRLSNDQQEMIFSNGFVKIYVTHKDGWETHYSSFYPDRPCPVKGWRVSYPHKRGDEEKGIWVEELVDSWPSEWFDTGYVQIKKSRNAAG